MKHQINICQLDPSDLVFENTIAAAFGGDDNKRLVVRANAQTKEIVFIIVTFGHEYSSRRNLDEAIEVYNQI